MSPTLMLLRNPTKKPYGQICGTLIQVLSSTITYSDRTAKNLHRSAVTNTSSLTTAAKDITLNNYTQVTNALDPSSSSYLKPSQSNKSSSSKPLSKLAVGDTCNMKAVFEIPWEPKVSQSTVPLRRREVLQGKKKKWVFESNGGKRFSKMLRMCTHSLGVDDTIKFCNDIGLLSRETRYYDAIIEICIEKVRNTYDEHIALKEFRSAYYKVFESMRKHGFEIGEKTYGPFLMFIIEKGMVEEFHIFCEYIKKKNSTSLSRRVAYYEMLLWIKVKDEDKIRMLIANTHGSDVDKSKFNESYLVALCEGNRQEEVLKILETIDVKNVSSDEESMERIFKSLGRLSLESHAKRFLMELKNDGQGETYLSNLIRCYARSIPNIVIEDIGTKFKTLQAELKVASSVVTYAKLIKTGDSFEV